jgi:hypothetical protein
LSAPAGDDLFALVYVPLTAILEEIASTVLPVISGEQGDLLAVGCLVMPHGDPFDRYVGFGRYERDLERLGPPPLGPPTPT